MVHYKPNIFIFTFILEKMTATVSLEQTRSYLHTSLEKQTLYE